MSLRAARSSAIVCWPRKALTQIGDSAGDVNHVIMADLSNPSNMAMRDKLLEEYKREYDGAVKKL